ncbi:1-(5-phosphoribosyl)-5-amino-4-imidazole-carboxylate (AIR) carboxylase [Candidatus Zixiibacteriota bacterium]|nr:1-(5-phosphoribosyl)-5-amino-4-imidazole-carboxylate (AIR) carboxylase [candidate division Zixibacteria bacterium]
MDRVELQKILNNVSSGKLSVTAALEKLRNYPLENLKFARIDHHRALRQEYPEVIYAPGKSDLQIIEIARRIAKAKCDVIISRLEEKRFNLIKKRLPGLKLHPDARMAVFFGAGRKSPRLRTDALVVVCSGGTSDIPVAEEAALTAWIMGCRVERLYDVGVAGIHRLFEGKELLDKAAVVIVVAGMEGALPSVVGGLISKPIIAVPTSIGYGASFGGIAALLAMLNSCAAGVTVVNIDNGFGAGVAAAKIARMLGRGDRP